MAAPSWTASDRGTGTLTVANSTFSDNGADTGGAIASGDEGTGTLSVVASTFSGDTAEGSGGGIESGTSTTAATALVAADIFSGSSCDQGGGTWTDDGYNVAGDTSCFSATPATGDQNGGTSLTTQLGSLGDNGGPTQTMMPLSGNPAIADIPLDATPLQVTQADGDAFTLCPVTADQRGDASPAGAACAAGAVQVAGLVTTPNTTAITLNGAPTTLTDTAVLSSGGNPTGTITFTLEYNDGHRRHRDRDRERQRELQHPDRLHAARFGHRDRHLPMGRQLLGRCEQRWSDRRRCARRTGRGLPRPAPI